jgi:hypothetical protein
VGDGVVRQPGGQELAIFVPAAKRAQFEALGPLSLRSLLTEHRALRTSVLRDKASRSGVFTPPTKHHSSPILSAETMRGNGTVTWATA